MYNPEVVRIWPSEAEKEEALRLEAEEAKVLAIEDNTQSVGNSQTDTTDTGSIDASAFNATTGSYSGLYGQGPVDEDTKAALDAILYATSSQSSVDSLLAAGGAPTDEVVLPR